jgi:hypothetical protein
VSSSRTLWTDLRAIDKAVVPRLAAALHRIRGGVRGASATIDAGRGGPRATMARLDRRYASRGVLGLVGDVPQVGAIGLALLLVIASVVTAVRISRPSSGQDSGVDVPTVGGPRIATFGPFPGENIPAYISAAQSQLASLAATSPNEKIYALADFEVARTPDDAARALPGVEPALMFVRVHVSGATDYFPSASPDFADPAFRTALQVSSLGAQAPAAFGTIAAALDRNANDLLDMASTITADQDQAQKTTELSDARHYRAEAAALRSHCACVYAVVVRGTAQTLLHIVDSGLVRAVDPASPGLKLTEITWVPLRPETKVRQPQASSGGP